MMIRTQAWFVALVAAWATACAHEYPDLNVNLDERLRQCPNRQAPEFTPEAWALFVGIDHYESFGISSLQHAVRDAWSVRDMMLRYGPLEKNHTIALLGPQATREAIMDALARLIRRSCEGDVVYVFFAGHARSTGTTPRTSWLMPYDVRDGDDFERTALSTLQILKEPEVWRAANRKLVLWLSACQAGEADFVRDVEIAGGWGMLASTFEEEPDSVDGCLDSSRYEGGWLACVLMTGLMGKADEDGDGVIEWGELAEHARSVPFRSHEDADRGNVVQGTMEANAADFELTRPPRRPVRLGEVPSEVLHPPRVGPVELGGLIAGGAAGVALLGVGAGLQVGASNTADQLEQVRRVGLTQADYTELERTFRSQENGATTAYVAGGLVLAVSLGYLVWDLWIAPALAEPAFGYTVDGTHR